MNTEVVSQDKIQPEHLRVVDVLLNTLRKPIQLSNLTCEVWVENSINVFNQPLLAKDIPSGDIWRWNQTKSRKTMTLPENKLTITLHKLIPRKRRQNITEQVPNHKLWYCVIHSTINEPSLYILWCERGCATDSSLTEGIGVNASPTESHSHETEVNVQDYSFLAEFMEPTQAQQLWPNTHQAKQT